MYEHAPLMVVGKAVGNHSIQFHEVVKHESYASLKEYMIEETFRSIENLRSTKKLLDKILDHTEANINDSTRDQALAYLQMRHIFVHQGGVADKEFENAYGSWFSIESGDDLPTDFKTAESAITATVELCKEVDFELIDKGFAAPVG